MKRESENFFTRFVFCWIVPDDLTSKKKIIVEGNVRNSVNFEFIQIRRLSFAVNVLPLSSGSTVTLSEHRANPKPAIICSPHSPLNPIYLSLLRTSIAQTLRNLHIRPIVITFYINILKRVI